MQYVLGFDGGGSGCRAALATAGGEVLGRGEGGPANINTDAEAAADSILTAMRQALAGHDLRPEALCAVLGLAGGEMTGAAARLTSRLPFARVRIVNDAVTSARGALGEMDGILSAIGTGSVYAEQRGGHIRQRGGRGFLLGDDASGAVMGRELLHETLRGYDGFTELTPLMEDMLRELGGFEGIIEFGNTARPADFAVFARRIVGSDDPAARRIFGKATDHVRDCLQKIQNGAAMPVVFTGGLGPFYAERLADEWPVRPALGGSLDGAVSMAAELLAAGQGA